ncbi:MAG: hypothetical protein AAF716_05205 [Cyanobacteria bacterium P01_D01_bin.1]
MEENKGLVLSSSEFEFAMKQVVVRAFGGVEMMDVVQLDTISLGPSEVVIRLASVGMNQAERQYYWHHDQPRESPSTPEPRGSPVRPHRSHTPVRREQALVAHCQTANARQGGWMSFLIR